MALCNVTVDTEVDYKHHEDETDALFFTAMCPPQIIMPTQNNFKRNCLGRGKDMGYERNFERDPKRI